MYQVITKRLNPKDPLRPHEEEDFAFIATHFKSSILCIPTTHASTPDLLVTRTNEIWEVKSPTGNGKRTIANNLRCAKNQSTNIILSLRRTKMHPNKVLARIKEYLRTPDAKNITKLKIILKNQKVIDILP